MGYRSDVLIAVAFSSVEHRDAVWAVYCIDPRVQQHKLSAEWHNYDKGAYPVLWFSAESVKWYDSYTDVEGIEHLLSLAFDFSSERDLAFASVFYRVGEEITDIEIEQREAKDDTGDMANMLCLLCDIERRITHGFS